MFIGRDAFWLAVGAVFALVALFFPLPFVTRFVMGVVFLVLGMIVALIRVGPDRLPPEQWLLRRLRYLRKARRYTYYSTPPTPPPSSPPPPPSSSPPAPLPLSFRPVEWAWEEIGVSSLITIALAVLGAYLVVWLYQGGASEIAILLQR